MPASGIAARVMPPGGTRQQEDQQQNHRGAANHAHAPAEFGKPKHQVVDQGVGLFHQRRRFLEFFRLLQFGIEHGHDLRRVEFKLGGIDADEAADIDRRGKHLVMSLFQGADMVGADFGGIRDLLDREF